jgi:hypothetical protein
MVEKPGGDPAPQLTREDVQRLHAAMAAAEPDWMRLSNVLASALERATVHVVDRRVHDELVTVAREYRRDVEAWHRLADDYFHAVGGPIEELLPLGADGEAGE